MTPIFKAAIEKHGYNLAVVYNPSRRSLELSNSGKVDGAMHRIYDFHKVSGGKYTNLVRIESHLMTVNLAVFSKLDLNIIRYEDLVGHTVVFIRGNKNLDKLSPQC